MDSARIAALLEPFLERPLSSAQLAQISTYIDLLLRWNARINLTAIRNPEEIVTRHFGESFFVAGHLFPMERRAPSPLHESLTTNHQPLPTRVVDLGSGAGFPALPLKIWAPGIHLTLIESNHKKAAFLREVARALTLTDVDVFAERAETLAARPEFPKADVVTFRAVENFDRTLLLAATFLAPHARLALLITTAQLPKLQPTQPQPTEAPPSKLKSVPTVKTIPTLAWRTIPVPQSKTRMLSIGERQ